MAIEWKVVEDEDEDYTSVAFVGQFEMSVFNAPPYGFRWVIRLYGMVIDEDTCGTEDKAKGECMTVLRCLIDETQKALK